MDIESFLTKRKICHQAFYDIVYEWEDELARTMSIGLTAFRDTKNRYVNIIRNKWPYVNQFLQPSKSVLFFEMQAFDREATRESISINRPNILPWIIDAYSRDTSSIENLYKNHSRNKALLISSREVYDHLQKTYVTDKHRLFHLALSLPDKYAISEDTVFEKPYDVVLVGRQNPVLYGYLERYRATHKGLKCLFRKHVDNRWLYFDQDGVCIGDADTRDNFMKIIRMGRVGLYSTPGIDSEKDTNGFSQVTPRFLEYVASCSHIIARYSKNSDTDYYELDKFSPNVETYDQFESLMDYALSNEVDMRFYSEYLKKHYTSVRAKYLIEILKQI